MNIPTPTIRPRLSQLFCFVTALLMTAIVVGPPVYAATIPQRDKEAIVGDWPHWNPSSSGSCSGVAGNSVAGSRIPGPVYLVGDSIGVRIQGSLGAKLAAKDSKWSLYPNVLVSRGLSGGSVIPDGIVSAGLDQDYIKTAKAVVVELGSNSSGFNANTIGQMIDKIRQANKTVPIYWVDTAVVKRTDNIVNSLNAVNTAIHGQASAKGYKVISWNKTVFGSAADPKKINPNAPDHGYIEIDGVNVHPSASGVTAMANLITNALTSGGGNSSTGSNCVCSGSSTTLSGSDNIQKIWNYLTSGKGLTAIQAAGLMGNLQAEGGFNPRRVEDGWGFPPEQDTMPPNVGPQGQPGYGIVQWTSPGRKQGLRDLAASRGVPDSDLATQLDWLWQELTGPYNGSTYVPLTATSDLRTATQIVLHNFEGPLVENLDERMVFANDILANYGGGTSGGGGGGGGGCATGSNSSIVDTAIKYSWPESHGLEPKPEYQAAIQQYNPGAPDQGADCGAFVATVMRASGADPNFPLVGTFNQEPYVRAHPELYDVVDSVNVKDLLPGDILIVNGSQGGGGADGHIFIYVGPQPPNNYNVASASGGSRMANLGDAPTDASGIVSDSRGNYLRARLK